MSTLSTLEPADPPLLEAAHLSRVAGGVRLVDDVTVRVRRREVLAVVGPSGSGKSSFLRLLNRLDEPTSALDEAATRDVETLIRRIVGDQKLACLLVTHDQAQAGRLAGRVMVLAAGKLERIGATDEVPHAEDRLH